MGRHFDPFGAQQLKRARVRREKHWPRVDCPSHDSRHGLSLQASRKMRYPDVQIRFFARCARSFLFMVVFGTVTRIQTASLHACPNHGLISGKRSWGE